MKKYTSALLIIIALLYFCFIAANIFGLSMLSACLKYLSMLCVFFIALSGREQTVKAALLLTLVCDYFLLFTKSYTLPVYLFALVHLIYIYRITKKYTVPVFLGAVYLMLSFLLCRLFKAEYFLPCYVFYALAIITNTLLSLRLFKTRPLIPLGMLCFICCDIFVVLFNLTGNAVFGGIIWVFYTPSQVMLALSSTAWKPRKI